MFDGDLTDNWQCDVPVADHSSFVFGTHFECELMLLSRRFCTSDSCIFATHYIASSHDGTFVHDVENNDSLCPDLWYCNVCGPTKYGLPGFIL
jgi:hypothetical protein